MNKYIFILLLIIPTIGFTQSKWVPSALRLGVNVFGLGATLLDKDRSLYEFNADIDVHKYFISFDYGIFDGKEVNVKYDYRNSGSYFRIGPDINFIPWEKDRSVFYFGVRYGKATFDDQITFIDSTTNFGKGSIFRTNNNLKSRWYEMLLGLKVPLWKGIELGLTGRIKFGLKKGELNGLDPILIPGYGRGGNDTEFALSYHILYRIPFRNKPIPPKPVRTEKVQPEEDNARN